MHRTTLCAPPTLSLLVSLGSCSCVAAGWHHDMPIP
jgi:hypothetical protein